MAETIEKDNNDDHVDYSSVIEDFSNDGYVIIENFFTHNDIVNSTKNKEQVNLIEILKRESLDLFNTKKEENDLINGVDDSTISSCILEPMNGQYINNYNLNNEIKLNKYKYKKARLETSTSVTSDIVQKNKEQISNMYDKEAIIDSVLFNQKLKTILTRILGEDIYLLNEQYIVKPPCNNNNNNNNNNNEKTTAFQWHRDYDSLKHKCKKTMYPYVSVWIALNDMTLNNGCLFILPKYLEDEFKQKKNKLNIYNVTLNELLKSTPKNKNDEDGNFFDNDNNNFKDKYFKPILLNKGDVCILSNDVWHCSVPNTTNDFRIAYMPQYSSGIICYDDDAHDTSANTTNMINNDTTNNKNKKKRKRNSGGNYLHMDTMSSAEKIKHGEIKKQLVAFGVKI